MKQINIESVQSLEDYLIHLGVLAVSLRSMAELHKLCVKRGIFNDDEIENARTVVYEIQRIFIVINDQIGLVTSRTGQEWEDILKEVVESLPSKKTDLKKTVLKHKGKIKKT